MKIKTKLRMGLGFVFLIALFFLNELSDKSKVILKENYKSLKFVAAMRRLLENNPPELSRAAKDRFEANLMLERNNITEPWKPRPLRALSTHTKHLVESTTEVKRF